MSRYLVSRLALGVLTLWGVATLLFTLFFVLADPSKTTLGQRADAKTEQDVRLKLGLDRPMWQRYLRYMNDLSPIGLSAYASDTGGYRLGGLVIKAPYLGRSYQNDRPVLALYFEKLPGTLILATTATLLGGFMGVLFGVLGAAFPNRTFNGVLSFFATLGFATPSYFAAVVLLWLFTVKWGEFTGLRPTGYLFKESVFGSGYSTEFSTLILPALTLGVRPLGTVFLLTRETMRDVLSKPYIVSARARGLSEFRVYVVHALRNALTPIISSLSNWFAALLAGAFFVEYLFDWQGVGKLTVEALLASDFPVISGGCLLTAAVFVVVNFITDVVYALADPRISKPA